MQNIVTGECFRCKTQVEEWTYISNNCLHQYCWNCFDHLLETKDLDANCFKKCKKCSEGFITFITNGQSKAEINDSIHQENLTLQLSSIRRPISHSEPISQPNENTLAQNSLPKKCEECGIKNSFFKCKHSRCMDCYINLIYPSILETCQKIYYNFREIHEPYCLGCIYEECKISYQSIPAELFIDLLREKEKSDEYENITFVIQVMTAFLPLFNGVPMSIIICPRCLRPMGQLSSTDYNCQWCGNENIRS